MKEELKIDWKKIFRGYFSWKFVEEFALRKGIGYSFWTALKHALDATLVSQRDN